MRPYLLHLLLVSGLAAGFGVKPSLVAGPVPGHAQGQPSTIDLDSLENSPEKYVGQTVVVEGEVDRVLGPHLFTIDERDWADLEREMPVVVPEPFAALVRTDTPVRVTGTVQKVPIAEIERRGFLNDRIRAEIKTQPVLVASDIIATQAGVTLRVRADQTGTPAAAGSQPVTDANEVAAAKDKNLVGKRVDLKGVTVSAATPRGFWIRTPSGERIFVMSTGKAAFKDGQRADIQGVVLELPEGLKVEVKAPGEQVYIYADGVTPR